jgi:NhaP-type Na+/H+ or K+/H+ antiporter
MNENQDFDILQAARANNNNAHANVIHAPGNHENVLFLILPVLLILLLAGGFFKFLLSKIPSHYRPPFTIVLFLFGFLVSMVNYYAASSSDFAKGTFQVTNIDPHTILLLLLPPLLFESSSKIDWHTFKRVAGQSIILAFPGVLICMGLTAVFVFYVFDYGWNWFVHFTLIAVGMLHLLLELF